MSESLNEIKGYRRAVLLDLYNQCTEKQQEFFNRMYVSVEVIAEDKIDWAIRQCERSIENNNQK